MKTDAMTRWDSSAFLAPPPAGTPLTPFRWTVEQCYQLKKLELFYTVRVILVRGELYLRPRLLPQHEYAIGKLDALLRAGCGEDHHVRSQSPIVMNESTALMPAVAVVDGDIYRYADQHPQTAALAVEVTNGSLLFDTTIKAELYATAGVPEYWIIDRETRQFFVYRDPVPHPAGFSATAYRTHWALGPAESVSPLVIPSVHISLSDLLL